MNNTVKHVEIFEVAKACILFLSCKDSTTKPVFVCLISLNKPPYPEIDKIPLISIFYILIISANLLFFLIYKQSKIPLRSLTYF